MSTIAASHDKRTIGQRELVVMVALLMSLNALAIDGMLPALDDMARELGAADGNRRQYVVAVYLLANGLGCLVPGAFADRFGRRSSQLVITSVILLFGLSFGLLMDPAAVGTGADVSTGRVLFFLVVGMTLMGLTFGSMSAILPELFPTNVRYTGSGVAYNTASILGAAITPYVAVTLNASYGVGSVGLYLAFGAVLTLVALWFSPETKDVDMENVVTRR